MITDFQVIYLKEDRTFRLVADWQRRVITITRGSEINEQGLKLEM